MVWKIVLVICLSGYVQSKRGAISEQRVVIHQLKSEQSDTPFEDGSKKSESREEYAWSYPSYEFSYKVNDPKTKDIKGQHEKRHGDEVKGLYWLIEPNGHKRTVNYQADDNNGFNAQVDYTAKQQSQEHKSKNSDENNEVEEKAKQINESNTSNEETSNSEKEKEKDIINNQANVHEQAYLIESNMEEQNNVKSQDNIGTDGGKISNKNNHNEENQNNENNKMNASENNKNECCSENLENENSKPVYEENQEKNIEHNYRRKSRAYVNRDDDTSKLSEIKSSKYGRSRVTQNNNKFRYRGNNEQNRKSGAKDENNQKYATRASRGSKNKETIDIDLKNDNDEKKEQPTERKEQGLAALNAKENFDPIIINKNNKENKSKRFEHRIRIHHPEPNVKN